MPGRTSFARVLIGGLWKSKGRGDETPPPPPPPPTARFPGDTHTEESGRVYIGASVGGGGPAWSGPHAPANTVAEHEATAGTSMGCRRTFYSSAATIQPGGDMYTVIANDHANDRLPVLSFKYGFSSWQNVSNGSDDTNIDYMINHINTTFTKPVVITVNHEPENDWKQQSALTEAQWVATYAPHWRAMHAHIRDRIDAWKAAHPALTNKITLCSILMAFTWASGSGRTPNDWWAGTGVHDVVAVDHYAEPGSSLLRQQWTSFVAWAAAKSVPIAVAELGMRRTDTSGVTKFQNFVDDLTSRDAMFLAYFDSNEGSGNDGYILTDDNGLHTKFHNLMAGGQATHLSTLGY